jgi:hypothetical protein
MSCLQIASDTQKTRNLLFEMPVPFSMRADVFEKYWPMVDNIWSRYDEINIKGKDGLRFDSIRFTCRFTKKLEDEYVSTKPPSKRQRREGGTCPCKVKAKYYHGILGVPDHFRFEHSSQKETDWAHSHTMEELDGIKINSFIKAAAALEAAKGHTSADVYDNMRNAKVFDKFGNPVGDALDAAGGKFMTRQHVVNAKKTALSITGGKFMTRSYVPDVRHSLKRPNPEGKVAELARIVSVDPETVWPQALGKKDEDLGKHGRIIRNDIRILVESMGIGGRTSVPRDILLPLLNSIADYMDKTCEDDEGKSLLDTIIRIQQQCGITPRTPPSLQPNRFNGPARFG